MRLAILKEGALVLKENDQQWLFGAPENIKTILEEQGIGLPNVVFTTNLRAPGMGHLGPVLSFKEKPLKINGMSAVPIVHKHGTDYSIETSDGKILFSERGDVSAEDVKDFHLAIIKNKHRSDTFQDNVITWPWKDSEFIIKDNLVTPVVTEMSYKVWTSMDNVPENLKKIDGTPLSLEQANFLARVAKASGQDDKENWAIAISSFKKSYVKKDDKWEKKKEETQEKEHYEQISQDKVQYKPKGGESLKVCANCEYYKKNMTCKKVEGDINPNGICLLWEYEPEENNKPMMMSHMEEKELVAEGDVKRAVKRFGDVITAALHKAYNDTSDHYFSEGYLSQDERMEVAKAVGPALTALRNGLSKDVMERDVSYAMMVPGALKELAPGIPDTIDERWSTVYKDEEGKDRWASISSVAIWDKQNELFSTKAMDWAIAFGNLIGFKGPLRYRHVPGVDGGDCDTQLRVGDFLFESGTFRDNPVGEKLKELMKDPEYGVSVGLAYAKGDIENGKYKRAAIFERSLTPKPAVPITSIITNKEDEPMKMLTEEELKSVAEELNFELAEVKTMYERAIAVGNPFGLKEFKEFALKEGGGAVTLNDDEKDQPGKEEYSRKDMLAILASLKDEELKELRELLDTVDKQEDEEDEEEEYTEEELAAMKKKAKKEDNELTQLKEIVAKQTESIQALANAMVGNQNQQTTNQAVADFLKQLPRQQASQFITESTKEEIEVGETDKAILAKLKALEEKLDTHVPGRNQVYDLFTSKQLNS